MQEPIPNSQFRTYNHSNLYKTLKLKTLNDHQNYPRISHKIQRRQSKLGTLKKQKSLETLINNPKYHFFEDQMKSQSDQTDIIDHDIELKQYLSGQKIFKDQNPPLTNFLNQQQKPKTPYRASYKLSKPARHKKQKSKSEINTRYYDQQQDSMFERINLRNQKQSSLTIHRNLPQQNDDVFSRLKKNKTAKYFEMKQFHKKQTVVSSLQIQLVLRQANQKKQITLTQLMRKLNLPKVKMSGAANLQRLIDNHTREKYNLQILHKRNNKTSQQAQNQKLREATLHASISRLQQNNKKQLRSLQKEIILSKMKSKLTKQKSHKNIPQHLSFSKNLLNKSITQNMNKSIVTQSLVNKSITEKLSKRVNQVSRQKLQCLIVKNPFKFRRENKQKPTNNNSTQKFQSLYSHLPYV